MLNSKLNYMLNRKKLEIAIKNKSIPQFVYKYQSQKFIESLLLKNHLWFSSPLTFNDPFDCQISLNTENTHDEIIKYFKDLDVDESNKQLVINTFVNDSDKWHKHLNQSARDAVSSFGICCFSKKEDDILLWSHYGDSHKGVCIKFDILKDTVFFSNLAPVKYDKNYPVFNHIKDPNATKTVLMLTKSESWAYEEEFRVIKFEKTGGIKIAKIAIVEITFGCRCEQNYIDNIISLTKKLKYNLIYRKAKINKSGFILDFEII